MSTEERDVLDNVVLEEIVVTMEGVELFTATSVNVDPEQSKELAYGAGSKEGYGWKRGVKKFPFSIECKGFNQALISEPPYQAGQGKIKTFVVNDKPYETIMDLRNVTLKFLYPKQDGTYIWRSLTGCEFSKDSFKMALSDAEGRTLTGEAKGAEGWF